MQWVGVGGLWKDEGVRGGGQTAAVYSYHGNLCLCGEVGRDEQCYRFSFKMSFSLWLPNRDLPVAQLCFFF